MKPTGFAVRQLAACSGGIKAGSPDLEPERLQDALPRAEDMKAHIFWEVMGSVCDSLSQEMSRQVDH